MKTKSRLTLIILTLVAVLVAVALFGCTPTERKEGSAERIQIEDTHVFLAPEMRAQKRKQHTLPLVENKFTCGDVLLPIRCRKGKRQNAYALLAACPCGVKRAGGMNDHLVFAALIHLRARGDARSSAQNRPQLPHFVTLTGKGKRAVVFLCKRRVQAINAQYRQYLMPLLHGIPPFFIAV